MSNDKEEILNKRSLIFYLSKEENDEVQGSKQYVLEAMDEYAKGFAEFIGSQNRFFSSGKWYHGTFRNPKTTEQMLEKYLEQKQNR